jgi:uncharacterized protein (TIGR03067 family)
VARKARAAAARRLLRESATPPPPPAEPADPSWSEVRTAVHEALTALPERYRQPLVACYLRGLTQYDAAAELGLSHAAVKKRLERGRDRLRAVLARRGFGPAVVLSVGAAPAAAVPDHLLTAAPRLAAGVGPIPHAVLGLVEGGSSMTLSKLGAVAALVTAVGVSLAAGGGEQPARRPAADNPAAPKTAAAAKENPISDRASELAGEWTVRLIETAGQPLYDAKQSDEFTPPPKFVFTSDRDGDVCLVKGVQVLFVRDFRYTTDPTKQHKEFDVTFTDGPKRGEKFVGIYALREKEQEKELRICLRLQKTDLGRPKGFVTNSGTTLYTFILKQSAKTPARSAASPPKADPPAADDEPPFDAILKSGSKLYFVLDRPPGEEFMTTLGEFGKRAELAARTTSKDQTVIFFHRIDGGPTGGYTGLSREQLRELASAPANKRADKLLEHAWVLGRLPKDAVPVPPVPRPTPKADAPVPPVGPATAGNASDKVLSAAELAAGMARGPAGVYGKRVEFTAVVKSVGKGVDGGVVPLVKVEGWPKGNAFGEVFVHNAFPDRVGKAGDRVRVRGRVVEHGYGTLTLWCESWSRDDGSWVPRTPNVPPPPNPAPKEEMSIYDRVHPRAALPGPGTEVPSPKDKGVAYYVTNTQRMWGEPANAGKHPGLYRSEDGGKTWKLVNTSFEFKTVFAHPLTGNLFAVVEHSWLGNDEKSGEITRFHADKAVMSADGGKRWKDITPPPGYIADITSFFADPDHPGRAGFVANVIRDVIYRPKDDRYSEYDRIRAATPEGEELLRRAAAVSGPGRSERGS